MVATDTHFLRGRLYTRLSGGEKQRVQLARGFAQVWQSDNVQPRLLLLDEPTAALDLAHQQLILASIRKLAASGCAIVLVAHDFNLVSAVADQITVLQDGKQAAHGAAAEVLTPEVFSRVFSVDVSITTHPDGKRPLVISS